MELAKPQLDVGLYTSRREAMLSFWREKVGLAFDGLLKLGGGLHQLRHEMNGSILKINHSRAPLPSEPPAGYRGLLVARDGVDQPRELGDPDGNLVTLVPPGFQGVSGIGILVAVRSIDDHRRFYVDALGCTQLSDSSFRCGDTMLLLSEDSTASSDNALIGPGLRYLTVQVKRVDDEHRRACANGATAGRDPMTLGHTARISFVRDPDGNWVELSQRASLTGSLD